MVSTVVPTNDESVSIDVPRWCQGVRFQHQLPRLGLVSPLCTIGLIMTTLATLADLRLTSYEPPVELDPKTAMLLLLTLPRAMGEDGWQAQP